MRDPEAEWSVNFYNISTVDMSHSMYSTTDLCGVRLGNVLGNFLLQSGGIPYGIFSLPRKVYQYVT